MAATHKELVNHCVTVLNTYDPEAQALEEHIENYITSEKNLSDEDETFILEVFSGCVRYNAVLQVVLDGFYVKEGRGVLRSEENLYKVLCYLALFRLDELGMPHYRKFVRSQDVNKMYRFLNFFSDDKNIRTWMKDEWGKLYEHAFVQRTLLSPILRYQPELRDLVLQLKERIDNKIKPKKKEIAPTESKPFNITKPRPRSVPMPEPIPKLNKHKPVPKTTYTEAKEQEILSVTRQTNRRKAEERLMDASRLQFACANPEKSEKTKQRLRDIIYEEENKLDFEKHISNPLPAGMLTENIPIKLNTAAILREGKLYQKKEAEEIKKLERLEAGAKDATDFLDWQNKMRQQDLDEQLAEIERRRLEGKLSHEEAILARQNLIKENRQKVASMKAEAKQMMQEYLEKKLEDEKQMKLLVEQIMDGHQNAKEAKKNLQEYKAKIVQEVNKESQELMKQALEEAEAEMRQKIELIHQIRAMEAVPKIRFKLVDQTETAGHGLLSELSIAELKERLSLLQVAEQQEEEERRDNILADKQSKEQLLMDTLDNIAKHRTELSKAAAIRFEQRKKSRHVKPEIKDEKLQELQRKLEEKRVERKKEQESSKIIPDRKSAQRLVSLGRSKKSSEASRWEELEKTQERAAQLATLGVAGSKSASRIARNRVAMTAS